MRWMVWWRELPVDNCGGAIEILHGVDLSPRASCADVDGVEGLAAGNQIREQVGEVRDLEPLRAFIRRVEIELG